MKSAAGVKKSQDIAGEGPQEKLYKAGKKKVDNEPDWC
jgi:hypothetical protein